MRTARTLGVGLVGVALIVASADGFDPSGLEPQFSWSPQDPKVGETITFDASNTSSAFSGPISFQWDFTSDGVFDATGVTTTFVYSEVLTATVTLRASRDAQAALLSHIVHVQPATARDATLTVGFEGTGSGAVDISPGGATCPPTCVTSFPIVNPVTDVRLSPQPTWGSTFAFWSGDCSGSGETFVSMAADRACTATFQLSSASGWLELGAGIERSSQSIAIAVDRSVASAPVIYAASGALEAGRAELYVRRYDGPSWSLLGGGPINADALISSEQFTPAIAIDAGGKITVAWAEDGRRIRVKQWDEDDDLWVSIGEDLNVDPSAMAFGTQITPANGKLLVAWIETINDVQGFGRMTLKRYDPSTQQWVGDSVLPLETTVRELRLSSETLGAALLMFVTPDLSFSRENPLRVIREGVGDWTDVCSELVRPTAVGETFPNADMGFGITRSSVSGEPVAVFNDGQSIFVVQCHNGAWAGLDGSADGVVAAIGATESMQALSIAQGEGAGVALAWTKAVPFAGNDRDILTQVLVENAAGNAMVPNGTAHTTLNVGFSRGKTALSFATSDSPVLGGLAVDGPIVSHVYRFVP